MLTSFDYCGKIFSEGENHAPYGTATHRMANRRGYCRRIGGKAKLSTGVDTVREVASLQIWQTVEGQTGRFAAIYRKQEISQTTVTTKEKASITLADEDCGPPMGGT